MTLVLERERELTILRLVGTGRRQIRRMVVGEAVVIGAVSQAIGLVVGLALSLVLIYVINVQSFGWTIQFHLPVAFLAQSSTLMVAATALAGLYPGSARRSADEVRHVTSVGRAFVPARSRWPRWRCRHRRRRGKTPRLAEPSCCRPIMRVIRTTRSSGGTTRAISTPATGVGSAIS